MKPNRSLLLFIIPDDSQLVPWQFQHIENQKRISELFNDLKKIMEISRDESLPFDNSGIGKDFDFFDWNIDAIQPDTKIEDLPNPGIVIAIAQGVDESPEIRAAAMRAFIEDTAQGVAREVLDSYLSGEKGKVEKRNWDIFLSYAESDIHLASELRERFEKRGIRCFMSGKHLTAGMLWESNIRSVLKEVLAIVLLLTPRSKSSLWVMFEAGASWALEKPLFPALMYVKPEELPMPIRKHQSITINTIENLEKLCEDVIRACGLI